MKVMYWVVPSGGKVGFFGRFVTPPSGYCPGEDEGMKHD